RLPPGDLQDHGPGLYDAVRDGVRILRAPGDPTALSMDNLLAWVMALNHALLRTAIRARIDPPDVIHAHDWLVAHASSALTSLYGVPLVATIHATESGRHQGWLPGPINQAINAVEWWLTYE